MHSLQNLLLTCLDFFNALKKQELSLFFPFSDETEISIENKE